MRIDQCTIGRNRRYLLNTCSSFTSDQSWNQRKSNNSFTKTTTTATTRKQIRHFLFYPLFTHRLQRRKSRLADSSDELEDEKSNGKKAKVRIEEDSRETLERVKNGVKRCVVFYLDSEGIWNNPSFTKEKRQKIWGFFALCFLEGLTWWAMYYGFVRLYGPKFDTSAYVIMDISFHNYFVLLALPMFWDFLKYPNYPPVFKNKTPFSSLSPFI